MPIHLEGLDSVNLRIDRMKRGVRDITPASVPIARYLGTQVRQQINSRGTHMGTPWAPLKPSYLRWKINNGFPRTILVKTGDLRKSFVRPSDFIENKYPDQLTFRSKDLKAIYHQQGTGNLPKRPILVLTQEIKTGVREIVAGTIFDNDRGKRYV